MTTNNETPLGVESTVTSVAFPPAWDHVRLTYHRDDVAAYGLACAKAVADAKDARIAALEENIIDMARTGSEAWSDLCSVMRSWQDKRGAERKPAGSVKSMRDAVISLQEMLERVDSDREPVIMGLRAERDTLQQRVGELESQLEAKGADAERYQEIRRGAKVSVVNGIGDTLTGQALDEYISSCIAARSAQATLSGASRALATDATAGDGS